MHALIIFLLVSALFALTLFAGCVMEAVVAKLENTKKAARRTKCRRIVKQKVQHNA